MPAKSFFDTLKDSINQIVSGDDIGATKESSKQHIHAAQNEIESAVIVLATEVMRLSGNHSPETEETLMNFLERNFGKKSSVKRRKQINDHIFVGPQPFTKMACEQLKNLATHESKFEIIKLLYNIASADDFVRSNENAVIQKIARFLNVSMEELKEIKEKYTKANNPFATLEMEETTSIEVVKIAYRKMVLKYHPDKRKDHIGDEEANKKFREIKRAYELILTKIKE
jgi:DnaJ like chaperone protein